jgi:hypothetical protein
MANKALVPTQTTLRFVCAAQLLKFKKSCPQTRPNTQGIADEQKDARERDQSGVFASLDHVNSPPRDLKR